MKLFETITIGEVESRNRIVAAPITTNFATEKQFVSNKILKYYEKIAEGGSGIIIVEASSVVSFDPRLGIYSDKFIDGLKELSRSIKKET